MQKHKQWLDNRVYEQHMNVLTKIKQSFRKKLVKSAANGRRQHHNNPKSNDEQFYTTKQQSGTTHSPKPRKTLKTSCKQKQLLLNNFLLGKRILQANPVINVKKQQNQYQKHKQYIEYRIQRGKKLAINTDFRQTKLKQYQINSCRFNNCHRLQTAARSRYVLFIKINSISFIKHTPILQDVILKLHTQNKKLVQSSEIINYQNFLNYEFYFKYVGFKNSTIIRDEIYHAPALLLDLYEMKGLNQRLIGGWVLQRQNIGQGKVTLKAQFRRVGKIIGEVQFVVNIEKRRNLKQIL